MTKKIIQTELHGEERQEPVTGLHPFSPRTPGFPSENVSLPIGCLKPHTVSEASHRVQFFSDH